MICKLSCTQGTWNTVHSSANIQESIYVHLLCSKAHKLNYGNTVFTHIIYTPLIFYKVYEKKVTGIFTLPLPSSTFAFSSNVRMHMHNTPFYNLVQSETTTSEMCKSIVAPDLLALSCQPCLRQWCRAGLEPILALFQLSTVCNKLNAVVRRQSATIFVQKNIKSLSYISLKTKRTVLP